MKRIILLLTICLITASILAQSGNVGIGTNSPQQKLHIAGGNVLIEDGIVSRSSTGATKDLLPVAIATIGSNGVVTGGTTNVTCTKNGNDFIVDIGKKNNDCQAFISLLPSVAVTYAVFKMTGNDDSKLRIVLYNNNDVAVSAPFNLLVFKAGNDPHHEYNITVATNVNALRIGHGYHGIVAYGVDSVTINITILSDVTIGGPDPDTANGFTGAISIIDIPCPAKITINNHGRIIGRGGRGGSGGGTYQSNSPNTSACSIAAGMGQAGGHAIYTEKKVTVNNYGFMAGGGGGGGGGKANSTSGANGGGGGTGAGWPLSPGGQRGSSFYGANAFGNCPPGGQFTGCLSVACCCGGYAPFAVNGNGNTFNPNGNQFGSGSGGAGINGGFAGLFGGGLALTGSSNANTAAGGAPGKVIHASNSNATGNSVNLLSGGSYTGVVD